VKSIIKKDIVFLVSLLYESRSVRETIMDRTLRGILKDICFEILMPYHLQALMLAHTTKIEVIELA
jgi:hypothetical protein